MTDTDDLLNEATRLAGPEVCNVSQRVADCLRALVERVRAAEAERDRLGEAAFGAYLAAGGDPDTAANWHEFFRPITMPAWREVVVTEVAESIGSHMDDAESAEAERDSARAKLDTVREGLLDEMAKFEHGDSEEGWPVHNLRNVLAILDGKDTK